ncbi:hypothetical protein [Janthinobacterium sp. FT14W]|uniref:hypothetical protein n=1 Tax=Janthinobacterium sp. FT14W TaxID=2654253 RepID=UPI00186B309F|nr:hypothetical protein [Janthinobacterium sp. FT14W]
MTILPHLPYKPAGAATGRDRAGAAAVRRARSSLTDDKETLYAPVRLTSLAVQGQPAKA